MTDRFPALTVWQPWATAAVVDRPDRKTPENRTWPPPSTLTPPFRLAVHAGQRVDRDAMRDRRVLEVVGTDAALPTGAVVGFVTVTGAHQAAECAQRSYPCPMCMDLSGPLCGACGGSGYAVSYCSRWAMPGQYHWTLDDPLELDRPWPCRGRQGIWYLPAEAARQMEEEARAARGT